MAHSGVGEQSPTQHVAHTDENSSKGCPVILVHGFGGWSRDTMPGVFWYWGASRDLASDLQEACPNNQILTASVGPFSSVWDRAVELFYQIKGGQVDYGQVHSERHGHSRYGRTYPGLYPQWDAEHPVHLVGHSMGGLTARALVQMMVDRGASRGETAALFSNIGDEEKGISSAWVKSVVTISTPHDGSPMVDEMEHFMDHIMGLFEAGFSLLGFLGSGQQFVYDYQLDQALLSTWLFMDTDSFSRSTLMLWRALPSVQWGVEPRQPDEAWTDYRNRIRTSRIWQDPPTDFCVFDLSPEGAAELTAWVDEAPNVVYMSFQSSCTWQSLGWIDSGRQWPKPSTNFFFMPSATVIGALKRDGTQWSPPIDASWQKNDAMLAPTLKLEGRPCTRLTSRRTREAREGAEAEEGLGRLVPSGKRVVEVNQVAAQLGVDGLRGQCPAKLDPGVWNFLGEMQGLDHLQAVGWISPFMWNATEFYSDLVRLLNSRV